MDYRSLYEGLEDDLRGSLDECYLRGDHDGLATLLEERGDLSPLLLLIRACAIYMDAMEIMVDQAVPASKQALELIGQAERAGLPADLTAPCRHEIEHVLEVTIAEEDEEITKAMRALQKRGATSEQAATVAHQAADRDKPHVAAALFLEAASLATKEAAGRNKWAAPDQTMNYVVRAGSNFAAAGDLSRATPLLRQAIDFDWKAGRLWGDRHTVQWAYMCFLRDHAQRKEWEAFLSCWREAGARCEELEMEFPFIHPFQEELLDLCLEEKLMEPLPALVRGINERTKRVPAALKAKVKIANDLLPG